MLAAGVIGCVCMILLGLCMVVLSFGYSNPAPRLVVGLFLVVIGIIIGFVTIGATIVPKRNLT